MSSADVLQTRLHAVYYPCNRARVLLSLLALKNDARMPDDRHRLASRKEHVSENRSVGCEKREGLLKLWGRNKRLRCGSRGRVRV